MIIRDQVLYTFDDVLLEQRHSGISTIDTDVSTTLSDRIKLDIPIMSAAMSTVTDSAMAIGLGKLGGIGIIHCGCEINVQCEHVKEAKKEDVLVGAAVKLGDKERVLQLIDIGVDVIVVDTSHGDTDKTGAFVWWIKHNTTVCVIAGNVANEDGTKYLIDQGADIIKVGIGPGAACTTRIVTGVGVPQLSAIMHCVSVAEKHGIPIIADGGARYSGDICKALAAGASCVMLGSLLAGTNESAGQMKTLGGTVYKEYCGMASRGASDRPVPEGVEGTVPYKGQLSHIIEQLIGGLRSSMRMLGAKNLREYCDNAIANRVTEASVREGHPHSITITKDAPNYRI